MAENNFKYSQWRQKAKRPPNGYHSPTAGGLGSKAHRRVAKFKFLKRFKVLENESIFQTFFSIYLARNIHFIYEDFRKIEQILQKFLNFLKNYFRNFKFYGLA